MLLGFVPIAQLPLSTLPAAQQATFLAARAISSNVLIERNMRKNVSGQIIGIQMISAADGSAFTGAVSALVTKDGATQTAGGGVVTHEGNGFHSYTITQAETNADHVAVTFTGTGAIPATVQVYTSFPQTGDSFVRLGAPVGASISADIAAVEADTVNIQSRLPAALVSGRIDASVGAMAANVLTASALAADAATEISNAVWDDLLSGHTTAGSAGQALSDVLVDTAAIGAPVGASISADIAAVKTQTAAIEVDTQDLQTRLPAALVSGRMDASVGAIASGVDLTATMKASVNTEVDTALSDVGLTSTVTGRIDVAVSTRASQTSVDTLAGYVDTEVAAIKTVTDKLNTTLGAAVGSPGEYEFTADALRNAPSANVPTVGQIADAVWDEVLTGATHNVNGSAGKRLRQLASGIILSGNVTAATSNTVSLDNDASSANGEYDPALVLIDSGTGVGQCRLILQYNGATKTAVVDRNWRVTPDVTSTYVLIADAGREHVNEGLAQGGTSTSITLNANASSDDNAYIGQIVFIRSGAAQDQARRVLSYNGTTKVATVRAWNVTPDTTSAYVMLPTGKLSDLDMANAVWDASIANHINADTTGEALNNTDLRGERTVVRGTVGVNTIPSTTQFTPSAITPAGAVVDQFKGRIIIFDNNTTTAALRGQATDIIANTNASTPLFTFTALTTAPVSGDTFSIV